jgi:hypothetical protein
MDTLCMLSGQPIVLIEAGCGPFGSMTLFDLHAIRVSRPSRWTFSLCGRTRMDTIFVLYEAAAFRTDQLCSGIIAHNDDYCGRQSRLTVDLQPGEYRLLVADKTADAAERYALRVGASLPHAGLECPRRIDPSILTPEASGTPSAASATPSSLPSATQISTATPGPPSSPSTTPASTSTPLPSATPTVLPPITETPAADNSSNLQG